VGAIFPPVLLDEPLFFCPLTIFPPFFPYNLLLICDLWCISSIFWNLLFVEIFDLVGCPQGSCVPQKFTPIFFGCTILFGSFVTTSPFFPVSLTLSLPPLFFLSLIVGRCEQPVNFFPPAVSPPPSSQNSYGMN